MDLNIWSWKYSFRTNCFESSSSWFWKNPSILTTPNWWSCKNNQSSKTRRSICSTHRNICRNNAIWWVHQIGIRRCTFCRWYFCAWWNCFWTNMERYGTIRSWCIHISSSKRLDCPSMLWNRDAKLKSKRFIKINQKYIVRNRFKKMVRRKW